MLMTRIETATGVEVSAEWSEGEHVVISQGGAEVGRGTLRLGEAGTEAAWCRIVDCAARLGAADGSETEAAYEALEAGLAKQLARR